MPHRNLNVLDAAEQAARQMNALIDQKPTPPLIHVRQLRDAAQSAVANIAEGFGRGTGRDRDRSLEIARGEAEETIRPSERELPGQPLDRERLPPSAQPLCGDREDAELLRDV
jgi:hypothetical protein